MAEKLTPSEEEWLLCIYEMSEGEARPVRIGELAAKLGAAPSSASRMARLLSAAGCIDFRRYGYILLTVSGREEGAFLERRRKTVRDFLAALTGRGADECAAEARAAEYGFSRETVDAMEKYLADRADQRS